MPERTHPLRGCGACRCFPIPQVSFIRMIRCAGLPPLRRRLPTSGCIGDNAYCIHNFKGERVRIPNILRECEATGNPNMPIIFTSFSKVSFSGAAVSAMASSKSNCEYIRQRLSMQTIGPDKLNQLRHVRFFSDAQGVYDHMKKHAQIVGPKFQAVFDILEKNLAGKEVAQWNPEVRGGYFISFDAPDGCAKKIISLCKQAGVTMTGAGATYPV